MSQGTSIRKALDQRLRAARFENWALVAHTMAGGENPTATLVLLHVVMLLEASGGAPVVVYHDDWRRLFGFGRSRVKTAARLLASCGVVYVNHEAQTWFIDEAAFWPAFEAALTLCAPNTPPPPDSDRGAGGEQGDVHVIQPPAAPLEGETGGGGVHGEHQIGCDSDKDESGSASEAQFFALFAQYRMAFRGRLDRWMNDLIAPALKLGMALTVEVVQRCIYHAGETWKYVHKSLTKELRDQAHGRQIALLPAVEVVKGKQNEAKPKNDLRATARTAPATATDGAPAGVEIAPAWPEPEPRVPITPYVPAPASRERDAWDTAYAQLEFQLDGGRFDTWLRDARLLRAVGDTFYVGVKNGFTRDMLQHRLYRNVARVLSDAWGKPASIVFEIASIGAPAPASDELPYFTVQAGVG